MTMTGPVTRADPRDRMRRGMARFAVLLAVGLGVGIGLAGPAVAHNVLIASDPAEGAVLQQAPTVISLTFDQPVQDFQPVVTVLGADGQRYESGTPTVDSTVVTQTVTTLSASGPYSIAYRVVSADGHPVQGEVRFELVAAPSSASVPASSATSSTASSSAVSSAPVSSASSSAAAPPAPPTTTTATTTTAAAVAPAGSSSGLSGWVWAAIAVAAALVVTAVVVIVRRPRQSAGGADPG
jgi:methionine-rich copper-binding protein CopC